MFPQPLADALSDRYRVRRELGRGGMATVYLADDLRHERQVAIKVISSDVATAIGRERFLREIKTTAGLSHPHIVPLHDSGAAGDLLYYVMPHIEGESLRDRLERDTTLPLEEALRIVREVASALGCAHQRGVIHRDVKPENILLSDGFALVADFGIARPTASPQDQRMTQVGTAVGSPLYMAPEQALGSADLDERADLYSLGCVLYELLAGRPPFSGPTYESILYQHLSEAPPRLAESRGNGFAGVDAVLARALAKAPGDRFASAARFAEALATAIEQPGTTGTPLSSEIPIPNNLPQERTHFIGREHELAACADLLRETRLLTLTGIGGGGKTRLAIRLARNLLPGFPDGIWFVDLARLTDGTRVAEEVAAAIGVKEEPPQNLTSVLSDHVRSRRLLLVLDNCEHLLAACTEISDALLAAGGNVRILATSREGLGVAGERVFSLGSLGVPPADASSSIDTIKSSAAVQLFCDRALVAQSGFLITEDNAAAIVEICRRLDGIPLAIELAAARVRVLSVEQIRAKLDDRFRLLTGGSKSAVPRHQTLQAAIQWSYDHLSAPEQHLLRTLSVFVGGWTLESATQVDGGGADEFEILDLLAGLVDKSLVSVERQPDGLPRYRLLDTVRQFALDRLGESGDAGAVRRRHFAAFVSLAHGAYQERLTRDAHWSAVLEQEHDNLRGALAFVRAEEAERHLELAGLLAWFWSVRSHLLEGHEHLTAALEATPPEPPRPARARALWGAANLVRWLRGGASAIPLMQSALGMWQQLGDRHETAFALEGLGWAYLLGGDDQPALATFEEYLQLQRETGDPALVNHAMLAVAQALVSMHKLGRAREAATQILDYARANSDARSEHSACHYLADCALIEGDFHKSLELYKQSLELVQALGDRLETSFEIEGVAMSLAGLGDSAQAVLLEAAVKAEWKRMGADPHMRFWDELVDRHIGAAKAALGAESTGRMWSKGLSTSFDEAAAIALRARAGDQAQAGGIQKA